MKVRMLTLCAVLAAVVVGTPAIVPGCCTPANQAPVAISQVVGTALNTAINITATATDPDAGPGPLAWILLTNPTDGVLAGVLPNVTYTPNAGTTGCDQFTFQVNDGALNSNVATIAIGVDNQAPTATDVARDAAANATTTIALAGNDPDNCPAALTVVIVAQPANGTLGTPTGLTVPYTPDSSFIGTDTFTYRVSDGLAQSATAAVATITVAIIGPTNRNIRLTLENAVTDRYIHYHMHLIAFREDVAVGDETRYTSAGYVHYTTGVDFGCYSFTSPARDLFYYYHQNGRFRIDRNNSSSALLSGIAPAPSATVPRLDPTFVNRDLPAPSLILFHDPQNIVPTLFNTGRSNTTINPALDDVTGCGSCGTCSQTSWYYVDENDNIVDLIVGCSLGRTDAAGIGRYFRVPAETQSTSCWDCVATSVPLAGTETCHWLHNTAVTATPGPANPSPAGNAIDVRCNEFYLNGVITYTFTNAGALATPGTTAPPSLKWEVKTTSGTIIHPPS